MYLVSRRNELATKIESSEVWGTSHIKLPNNEVNVLVQQSEVPQTAEGSIFVCRTE